MQVDKNDDADPRSSESDPGSIPTTSSKLGEKLQKLAEWRIDPSSIEFDEDASESRGGYATVSRAFLVSTSGAEKKVDNPARTEREGKSDGRTTMRKTIAVKKLKIDNGKDKERVLGLALREAGFITQLSHHNVIKLEGFVEDISEDRVWLVFPWATNGNLKDFVALVDWEIPERVCLIYDVASGVEYLHSRDPPIYHGDLKSVNILVNSAYRAVITDFGSARYLAKKGPTAQPNKRENGAQPTLLLETEFCETTNTVTLTGNQYTLRWAAPELLMDSEPGLWSDIWALGWIFYEVMTNAIPFQNVQKDSVVVIHVIQGNLPSVADHARVALIRALYSLMVMCWSIDPSKRPTAEGCRKSMTWMPKISPDPNRASNTSVSRVRSPELLTKLGNMHLYQNDYTNASVFYTQALAICTDDAGKADALFGLAEVHRFQAKYSEATTFYSEVVQISTKTNSRQRRAKALFGLADVHRLRHEYGKAAAVYSEVAQLASELGNRKKRADALWGLAEVHRLQGEYSKAVPLFSEAVQICIDIGNRSRRTDAMRGLAEVHRAQKQYSQAIQVFSEVLQNCINVGDRYGRAWALIGLANVYRDQGQHEDALRLYEQAARLFEEIGSNRDVAIALKHVRQLKPAEAE